MILIQPSVVTYFRKLAKTTRAEGDYQVSQSKPKGWSIKKLALTLVDLHQGEMALHLLAKA